jgi:hypothetical protein
MSFFMLRHKLIVWLARGDPLVLNKELYLPNATEISHCYLYDTRIFITGYATVTYNTITVKKNPAAIHYTEVHSSTVEL